MFCDRLIQNIEDKNSALCVGLDPHLDLIPDFLKKDATSIVAIEEYLSAIVDAVAPHCAIVKPNTAFFEVFGSDGWRALENICIQAKQKGLLVLADAKRGDIGSTAARYASAFLSADAPYDALTVNPFMGSDTIIPFVDQCAESGKGIFVLVKTSNPGSGEFMDQPVGDSLLHEEVARMVARLGTGLVGDSEFSSIGAVVGASYPDDMRILRSEMPAQIFLVPGLGAQGGTAEDVQPAFYNTGKGAIINASRSVIFAGNDLDFDEKAAQAAEATKEAINHVRFANGT